MSNLFLYTRRTLYDKLRQYPPLNYLVVQLRCGILYALLILVSFSQWEKCQGCKISLPSYNFSVRTFPIQAENSKTYIDYYVRVFIIL